MTYQAHIAINAAKHYDQWGWWATLRYCEKRSVGIRLLVTALRCERGAA